MDGAALLLLVSGVGVAFGWQPMPDGSQRYEYTVQIEPELAATLAEGKSIPIIGDVPEDVQPIGRIRLVVGRDELPRQRLVTHLKPVGQEITAGQTGVALAQYNRYAGEQYGSSPAPQQQPPTSTQGPAAAANPYAPQQPDAQRNEETAWNNGEADPPITPTEDAPPSGQQLFGPSAQSGNTWNSATPQGAAATVASNPLDQVGKELERAAAPIQNGIERVDSEVRGAVDNLGDRTRNLVDELRQPFRQPQPLAEKGRAAAPGAGSESGSIWNTEEPAATGNPLRDIATRSGATWNHQPSATGTDGVAPPFVAGQGARTEGDSSVWNGAVNAAPGGPQPRASTSPQRGTSADPWAGVPDPRPRTALGNSPTGAATDLPGATAPPKPFGGVGTDPRIAGPHFPNLGNGQAPAPPSIAVGSSPQTGVAPSAGTPPAVVGSKMLNQPANRPLDEVATGTASPMPVTVVPSQTQPTSAWPGTTQPQTPTVAGTNPGLPGAQPAPTNAAPPARDNTLAVLLAWVLLSGSIAGNLYLFWSYLDVRQKYRALVRKTARAVGSRFSAA